MLTLSLKTWSFHVIVLQCNVQPWLHKRFFACDGDAIFLKIVASPMRRENYLKFGDFTSSLCRIPQKYALKCVLHVQYEYLCSFNQ